MTTTPSTSAAGLPNLPVVGWMTEDGRVSSDERMRLLASFLRHTENFHQSDTQDWLYVRDGDGNTASVRVSEITEAIHGIFKELL